MFKKKNRTDNNPITLAYIFLIIIVGFLIYSNSLKGQFIWDDGTLIKENTYVKNWSYLPKFFSQDIGAGAARNFVFYRPLQMVTYMIDYSFWKLNTLGYHLTNILLHILAALSIFWFISILFNNRALSLLTSIFFVAHPIHTEAVSYISGRSDSLAFIFLLLSFITYIKQIHLPSKKLFVLMLLNFILALLSRENSLILSGLILVYHYSFKEKIRKKEFYSLLIITTIYIIARKTVLKSLLSNIPYYSSLETNVFQRLPGFFVAIVNYIKLLFLPFDLHMEYGGQLFIFTNPKATIGLLTSAVLIIFAWKKRDKNKIISFLFCGFLLRCCLFPILFILLMLIWPSIGCICHRWDSLLFWRGVYYHCLIKKNSRLSL